MIYLIFSAIAASSSLTITRNKDASSSYLAKIETLSIASLAFMLTLIKAIDRFSAVLSISAKSFP
jgi:hypothetical protein